MATEKPSVPSGMRDFLPKEMAQRDFIFSTMREVFRRYGYEQIETPTMEHLSTLTGKYGEEGDRLIYRVLNLGNYLEDAVKAGFDITGENAYRKFTPLVADKAMRYDLTVPFARVVVQHQNSLAFPFRRFQIQPVWRADRPGKGRYREFYQCDCDVIGSDSLLLDAELAAIYDEAFAKLNFPGVKLLLNNRKVLTGIAEVAGAPDKVADICISIDKLDKIGEEKVKAELLSRGVPEAGIVEIFRIILLTGSNEEKIAAMKTIFANSETGRKGIEEMEEVLGYISDFGMKCSEVVFDLSLARGLDYYTGTIYEIKAKGIEYGSLGGGGRYDNLTGIFGLKGMSGVGVSFGADRIHDVMIQLGLFTDMPTVGTRALIVNFGGEGVKHCVKILAQLRNLGVSAEIYPDKAKMDKQFKYADRKGIPYTVIIGDNEREAGTATVKTMASGEQRTVPVDELANLLQA